MLKILAACFRKSGTVHVEEFITTSPQYAAHLDHQDDYDQVNALNLFYDMAVPVMLELKGQYLIRKELVHLYKTNFVTAANRAVCLNMIKLQLDGICSGEINADAVALAEAKKLAPLIDTITSNTTTLPKRMEAMMAWALGSPEQHAALIYKIYDQLFASCKMQSVPSLRLGIPYYLIDRHGADEALRIWRNTSATARNHQSSFERYRHFLEAVWLPYLSLHDPMAQAILEELHGHFGPTDPAYAMPRAYMELGEAMSFSPTFKLDTEGGNLTYSFRIQSKTLAGCRRLVF